MRGSCLILGDVPENTEIGIDMKFWRVGQNFKGIKDIPVGFHYVYFSAVNADHISGQRVGFAAWFTEAGFTAKKWQPQEEDFIDVNLSTEDCQRLEDNYDEVSVYLGPYPSESHRDWVALTNLVSPLTVTRLLPSCGRVFSCTQFLSQPSSSQQRLAAKADRPDPSTVSSPEDLLPKLEVIPGTELQFTDLPKVPLFPPNSSPMEITANSLDRTFTLETVISALSRPESDQNVPNSAKTLSSGERELLAELQFCYVTFLLNHVMDGWYQWRRIVQLLANCERAITLRPQFYTSLITVLYHQLANAAGSDGDSAKSGEQSVECGASPAELADLFFSEATSSAGGPVEPAFLPSVLRSLLRNIMAATSSDDGNSAELADLRQRAEGFACSLNRRFGWGFNLESLKHESEKSELLVDDVDWDGDEAPVVVETNE
ncbi:unnamed protein product [Calicophoron daubneyi]|uniref:Protein AAR2 homolog n=1 Tax=Calicophoron daubneyi TaxID=300641 RepID=A0AAV2TEM4_CALDB